MILGTHNTMTYLKPKQWYLKPFKFLARCQKVDYKTQAEKYGVKMFDLRIFWDKDGNLEYRHAFFHYDASNFDEVLKFCDERHMYVRFLFELRLTTEKRDDLEELKNKFIELCKEVEIKYPNITFFGGCGTEIVGTLYDFKNDIKDVGLYSSVTSLFPNSSSKFLRIMDDWCPWIYATLMNKKNHKKYDEEYKDKDVCLMYDFIEKQ